MTPKRNTVTYNGFKAEDTAFIRYAARKHLEQRLNNRNNKKATIKR